MPITAADRARYHELMEMWAVSREFPQFDDEQAQAMDRLLANPKLNTSSTRIVDFNEAMTNVRDYRELRAMILASPFADEYSRKQLEFVRRGNEALHPEDKDFAATVKQLLTFKERKRHEKNQESRSKKHKKSKKRGKANCLIM